ncbi:hypothetical protein QBC41DRAFT_396897 [Cercophora samala]|uniref:Uncharacterized protein n=1 Tax=Cercophora samala TaxID=330535 RepID=A0AA39ZL22_9PEZI|nr:hypothetical protein QBC41DRAFT_396897 [Cercophora samala]
MATPQYSQLPEAFSNEAPEVARESYNNSSHAFPQVVNDADTAKQYYHVSAVHDSTWSHNHSTPPLDSSYQHAGFNPVAPTLSRSYQDHAAEKPRPVESGETWSEAGYKKKILILSVLVGVLAAVVVGLAAATGVMAKKANDNLKLSSELALDGAAEGNEASATRTVTTTVLVAPVGDGTSSPVPVAPIVDITRGCSDKNQKVTGTRYTTELYGKVTFELHCHAETRNEPFYALSTPNFEACLDACACWSSVMPTVLGDGYESNNRAKCAAAHFVPLWTNKTEALKKNARGNCFLKPNSPNANTADNLNPCTMGSSCHSGIVVKDGEI